MKKHEIVDLMKSSKTEKEWNENCNKVKRAHHGKYPDCWFELIISKGITWGNEKDFKL